MKTLKVNLDKNSYPLIIGRNILFSLNRVLDDLKVQRRVFLVTNLKIAALYLPKILKILKKSGRKVFVHFIPDSEKGKSEHELFKIYSHLVKLRFDRSSCLLALGGGVVGDVTGFAAATYMRGVQLVNIPTTLLAQLDSAIGGKTGINLREGKNLVGSFYQPKLVFSDLNFLKTLSRQEMADSLAEVIKYGVIKNSNLFTFLEKNIEKALDSDLKILEKLVYQCSQIKKIVVEKDEKEEIGLRSTLNYGHTFAHALEGSADFRTLRHGEAVALGMVAAGALAIRRGIFSEQAQARQVSLIRRVGLPTQLGNYGLNIKKIITFMQRDKKIHQGKLRFILPLRIGKVICVQGVNLKTIKNVLKDLY